MKLAITLLSLSLAGGLATEAHAQPVTPETRTDSIVAVNVELRRQASSAERAFARGNYAQAASKYEAVVKTLREHGLLPSQALWRLAGVYFAEGNALRAAATLDALACEAEAYKNVQVQVSALLEAGRVYEAAGLPEQSVERLKRAVELLDSPELSKEVVASLVKRMRE